MSLPPLLVSGLPSSGGAVVAEALLRSGCQLGGPFLPLPPRDAIGCFVDREIHRWHASALAGGEGDGCAPGAPPRDPTPERRAELAALLDARFDRSRPWAVRSPRLLWARRFWEAQLESPRWLIVVRRPAVQAWSQVDHRQPEDGQPAGDLRAVWRALGRWRDGSRAALALARAHPDRVAILDAAQLAGGDAAVDCQLRERWRLPLAPLSLTAALRPFLLRRRAPAWVERLAACDPRLAATWRALRRLTPATEAGGRRAAVRICVVAKHRFAPSESFIQEQLRRLPGEVHFAFRRDKVWHDRDCLPLIGATGRLRPVLGGGDEALRKAAQDAALARFLTRRRVDVLLANFGPL
ncbi:MAG: hypothetical protein NDJ75_09335, partial [Thermoanaerobaculia bacterium]|nr:hypothetical protein [Thermoanaerobaculia bacterium]